ncbi:MAG: hypothetical protein ACYS26_20360 [Planctomycetota bacterium]
MAKPPSKKSGKGSKAARKSQESNATSKLGSGSTSSDAKTESGPVVREDADPVAALSMSDAAAKVGVAARTLQRRAAEGRLPVVVEQRGQRAIWRVLPADLAAAFPDRAAQILAQPEQAATSAEQAEAPSSAEPRPSPPQSARPSGAPNASAPSNSAETAKPSPADPAASPGPEVPTAHPVSSTKSQSAEAPAWVAEMATSRDRLQADLDRHKQERHELERELAVSQTRLESARAQVGRLESQVQGLEQSHRSEISSQDERHRQAILALREALDVAREELSAAKAMPLSIEAPDTEELQRKGRRQIAGAVAAVAFGLGGPLLWASLELGTVRAEQKELQTERDGLVTQTQRDQGELTARRAELDQLRVDLAAESELKDQHLSDLAATREQAAQLGEQLSSAQETGELLASELDSAEQSARQAELERVQAQADAAAKAERVADLEGDLTQLGERLASSEERRGDLELQVKLESERADLRSAEIERLMGELDAWQTERGELLEQLATLRAQLEAETAKATATPAEQDPSEAPPGSPASGSSGSIDEPDPVAPASGGSEAQTSAGQEPSSASALGPFIWRRVGGYWWPFPDPTV